MPRVRKAVQESRDLQVLRTIAEALNAATGVGRALTTTLDQVTALLGLEAGWIWLIDPHTRPVLQRGGAAAAAVPARAGADDRPSCWCLTAFRAGELTAGNIDVMECSRLRARRRRARSGRHPRPALSRQHPAVLRRPAARDHERRGAGVAQADPRASSICCRRSRPRSAWRSSAPGSPARSSSAARAKNGRVWRGRSTTRWRSASPPSGCTSRAALDAAPPGRRPAPIWHRALDAVAVGAGRSARTRCASCERRPTRAAAGSARLASPTPFTAETRHPRARPARVGASACRRTGRGTAPHRERSADQRPQTCARHRRRPLAHDARPAGCASRLPTTAAASAPRTRASGFGIVGHARARGDCSADGCAIGARSRGSGTR